MSGTRAWTTPSDLRAQVQRLWDRGELLRDRVSNSLAWPVRLTLRPPAVDDLTDRFEAVRDWVQRLAAMPGVRIDWRDWQHRVQGRQRLPAAVWIDSLDDALALVGKGRAARRFEEVWTHTESVQPVLLAWLSRRPLQALELTDRWERLLDIVGWLQANPRPKIYLRQVDVTGIDTKFIEANRGVLSELLDLALPPEAIDPDARGVAQFARRFGFLEKPERIRFRLLDRSLPSLPGCEGLADISLDADSFARLALPIDRLFITENETNFLAFPPVDRAIVIFGAGYGWDALSKAGWLSRNPIHYWGDIDTHGFAILDQLRSHFPAVRALLMDRETLLAHRAHWGEESDPADRALSRLTAEERALHDDLRLERIQPRLRLEQERVGFTWLVRRLKDLA